MVFVGIHSPSRLCQQDSSCLRSLLRRPCRREPPGAAPRPRPHRRPRPTGWPRRTGRPGGPDGPGGADGPGGPDGPGGADGPAERMARRSGWPGGADGPGGPDAPTPEHRFLRRQSAGARRPGTVNLAYHRVAGLRHGSDAHGVYPPVLFRYPTADSCKEHPCASPASPWSQ